jgi:glycosyltransferase involved in cell wall biosynthesis
VILHLDTEAGWRGGQQQVLYLAAGLAAAGTATAVVCRAGSDLESRLRQAGVAVHPLAGGGPWHPGRILAVRRLAQKARVVHAHASHAHTLAALATWGLGVPLVVTRRVDFAPKGLWKYRRASRVVAISQAIAGILRGRGLDPVVIPSGIDPARATGGDRQRGRAALGMQEGDLAVLCVAALEDHKDHRTLLRAWSRVAAQHPTAYLLLAGDGALRHELEALATPRVRFLGFRADVPDLLAAADVFALTSHLEGLGTTVIDAQACGLPVVATAAGGIPELIDDGTTGLLCPVRDDAAVATALHRALADPQLRLRLGTGARAAANRFTAAAMVASYARLYAALA